MDVKVRSLYIPLGAIALFEKLKTLPCKIVCIWNMRVGGRGPVNMNAHGRYMCRSRTYLVSHQSGYRAANGLLLNNPLMPSKPSDFIEPPSEYFFLPNFERQDNVWCRDFALSPKKGEKGNKKQKKTFK